MKKLVAAVLALMFTISISATISNAATKKKAKRYASNRRVRYKTYSWPKGPRPVFPTFNGNSTVTPTTSTTSTTRLPQPQPTASNPPAAYFLPKTGLSGGALLLGVDYLKPLQDDIKFNLGGGFGLGNGYTVFSFGAATQFNVKNDYYVGFGLDLASYSKPVSNVFGISGNVDEGIKIGLGIMAGTTINKWHLGLGYSSALGLTAKAGYKF